MLFNNIRTLYCLRMGIIMRLISTKVLKPGMIIGRTIWNDGGHPLIQKDVPITESIIKRLKQLNVQYVYINDELSKGIEVKDLFSHSDRQVAVSHIKQSFRKMKGVKQKEAIYILDNNSKMFKNIVDDILTTILNNNEMLTVLTDTFLYDEYLYNHSLQVTIYSLTIAKELGYSVEDLKVLGIGALLHDIGKIVVPPKILNKPAKLTDEEYEIVKQHAQYGFDILRHLHTVSLHAAHCAFQHHERLDGSGYPRGIKGDEMHPYAKVIAVADVFDAMTSNRVYRDKILPHKSIEVIKDGRGKLFDEDVVDAFLRSVVHYPNGTVVLLSDGRRGIVVKQNVENSALPHVRIFEENYQIIDATYHINLMETPNVTIIQIETDYI